MADLLHPASEPRWPTQKRPNAQIQWVRQTILTRLAAAGWWLVMIFFDVWIVLTWIGVAMDPTVLRAALALGLTVVAGIPIVHEWPKARRMGRMLVRGT
jgi:hypothetical protein